MKPSLNLIILVSSFAFLSEDFITEKNTYLLTMLSRYEKIFLLPSHYNDDLKGKIDVDMFG